MNNFDDAARLLAQPLGDLLLALPEQTKEEITELRVRRGRPLVVMLGSRTCFLTDGGKLINHCSARALDVTDAAFSSEDRSGASPLSSAASDSLPAFFAPMRADSAPPKRYTVTDII